MTPSAAPTLGSHPRRGAFSLFGRSVSWIFSQKHFHVKLFSGTAAGVIVIIFLAGVFLFLTFRNHLHEGLRNHTVNVMRLSSVIENDISVLETAHRGYLLTGNPAALEAFETRRQLIKQRIDDLTGLILNSPLQRKRIMKLQEFVQNWLKTIALPEIAARQAKGNTGPITSAALGHSLLGQAHDLLQSLQNEEQILLNQRMRDQEWAAQSTQILDLLPKLERSAVEMEKEKRGYLLTGENSFIDSYNRAATAFSNFHGYLSILVANNAEQSALLSEIRSEVDRWISNSATPEIEARRTNRSAGVLPAENGESLMSDVRSKIGAFEKNAQDAYEARVTAASHERIVKTIALGVLCFLAVSLLVVSNSYSCVLVRRQLCKLDGIEARINSIIQNILDGMIIVDAQGVIQSMNPAAEKMFGCIENEMIGHTFIKLVPRCYAEEAEAPPTACAWDDLARHTGRTTIAVGRTRRQNSFPIEISLSEMTVDDKQLFVAMVRDVTERKRFEQEIDAEKENLAVTLRSIGDGVITTDVQGKIIMINKAGEGLTGWESKDAIGQPLKTVFNVEIDVAAQARAQKSGSRNEAQSLLLSLPENATLVSRAGSDHVVEQVASPIRDSKNEVVGVVLVFRDITERQRNEAERRKAETLEQLGLLAGGIAHDFNNLLTAIIGNISLASLLLPPNDEMGTRLNDAKNASMRARDLAQQLLTFARGGAPIKKTSSIGKLIQDTVSFSLRGTHSRSEFTFEDELWPAEIDPGQISQVVANLVVNADQAMPNGGTLHVSCDNFIYGPETPQQVVDLLPGEYIRIRIRDEGVGIPDDYMKRIFDPYFTTKAKGNGLGLATTYSIIKNHNGLITVESQVHFGSTFTIYLPAARDQAVPMEPTHAITPDVQTGSGHILIVDDEEAIRALVEFTLSRLGYEVAEAETAQEGVNLYRERMMAGQRFDVVILDLTLPGGMGGKEALKKLIEIDPTVNAIVSSGYAMDSTMSRYQDFGFRGVIAKPYEASELGRIVKEVIEGSHVNLDTDNYDGGRLAERVA